MDRSDPSQRNVAVIGSGVSGLVAAYALALRDRVTLYEADSRLGGHAHTHYIDVDRGDGDTVAVDSAFLVHNDRTYPTLCRLFDELGIATQETDMSMSVRDDASGLEYAGARGFGGLFPSMSSLTRPRYLLMLAEVKRFHRAALRLLESDADDATVGDFLDRHGFSQYFIDHFMTPLIAAVWSSPPGQSLRYPARYLFVFLEHHGMLSVFGSPTWRTVVGGSATYVDAVANNIDEVRLAAPVRSVRRVPDGVEVTAGISGPRLFDAAVIATHPRPGPADARRADARRTSSARRHRVLHQPRATSHRRVGAAEASPCPCVVELPDHSRRGTGAGHLRRDPADAAGRRVPVPGDARGHDHVDPAAVLAEMTYSHPMYTPESVAAQQLLPTLDDERVVFAGAYHGWGFHEDGAASGLRAARRLGAEWPATPEEAVPC